MKIGYLYIGSPTHGINRYARLIAAEAQTRSHLDVIEAAVELSDNPQRDRTAIIEAAKQLSAADVVHFQYNRTIWGDKRTQLTHLDTFLDRCTAPLVVTLHDIFYPPSSSMLVQQHFANPGSVRFTDWAKAVVRDRVSANLLALQKVIARSQQVFVCTQEEARRLQQRMTTSKINVVPHFIEVRNIEITREAARTALDLEGFHVITLLGFIYSGKGHQLLVETLPQLPENTRMVFAGSVSPGHEAYFESLMTLAEKTGVRDRIRVTGYLSESDLESYLMATDLAVCPFKQTSASSSLASWISVARPVLASKLPQIEEYNQLQPNAIATFDPYTAEALQAAIQHQFSTLEHTPNVAMFKLAQDLHISKTVDLHLTHYQKTCLRVQSA
ncbi:glycosyltransferase [Pseudanabaenaceae cyanobacterium LEGE 13415]|nr:glycosyltransferase [Pseudanabaenaceae cyanobacterium LEGE 13415]